MTANDTADRTGEAIDFTMMYGTHDAFRNRPQMKEAQFSALGDPMMQPTTVQALGQARQSGRRTPGLLAALTGWARRPQARQRVRDGSRQPP